MSDVTNNEEVVETPVAEEVVEVVETVEAEAPAVEEAVAEEVVEAEAPVAEEVVEEVVVEAAPAPAPKAKVPATFVIKVPTKTAKVEAAVVESDGTRANARKVREGIVLSNKMDQTLVVVLTERVSHPKYGKTVQRSKKLYVHDANNDANIGDRVRVVETRPLSKLKRWRLTEIVERARCFSKSPVSGLPTTAVRRKSFASACSVVPAVVTPRLVTSLSQL